MTKYNFVERNSKNVDPEIVATVEVSSNGNVKWSGKEAKENREWLKNVRFLRLPGKKFNEDNPEHWKLLPSLVWGSYSWVQEVKEDAEDENQMDAIFIRHKLETKPEILEDLWDKRLIAVHYGNIESTNPNDFEGQGKKTLKRLWKYCDTGVLAAATYREINKTEMLVGEIPKGSKIMIRKYPGLVYKTVQLINVEVISYQDYPLLSAIQPRGTITGWPSAQIYLQAIKGKKLIPWNVQSLHPSQLEIICSEYLRMEKVLRAQDMLIGKSMQDVDIYGIGERGKTIIAQVTNSIKQHDVEKKLKILKTYHEKDAILIFFGPEACRIDDPMVQYIANEDVFAALDNHSTYHRLLKKMLRWETA